MADKQVNADRRVAYGATEFEMIFYSNSCNCGDVPRFAGGSHPEFYDGDSMAIRRYRYHLDREGKAGRYLYWAIHLRGRHIINVSEA